MTHSAVVLRTIGAIAVVALAACSSKPEGTYVADFSSSNNPNVALASALMKMSLTFDQDHQAIMEIEALGNSEKVKVDSVYDGDRVVLTRPHDPKKEKFVFAIKDESTLKCEKCPEGMPSVWKKKQ